MSTDDNITFAGGIEYDRPHSPPPIEDDAEYPRSFRERPVTPAAPAPLGKGHFFTSTIHPNCEVHGEVRTTEKPYRYSMPSTHVADIVVSAELVPNQAMDDEGRWILPGLCVIWFRPTP